HKTTRLLFWDRPNINMQLWTDKYAPSKLDEIVGNGKIAEEAGKWAEEWESGKGGPALLLEGPTGIGKTSTALAIAKQFGWEVLELNTSDERNAAAIDRIAGASSVSRSFSGKTRMILFDEIDGLYKADSGGASAIVRVIKSAKCPIIMTASDEYNQKLTPVKKAAQVLKFRKVHYATVANHLERIAAQEGKKISRSLLIEIAKRSSSDLRSAINDMQIVTSVDYEPTEQDLEILLPRDRSGTIFNTVRTVMKSMSFRESRDSLKNLNEQPDFVMKWISENIPHEYKDEQESADAAERISKADIYLGRVFRRSNYGFWRYASDLMSAGVSLSKEEPYHDFVMYRFPSFILGLSKTKKGRGLRMQIAGKVGKQAHVSNRRAVQDYLPMMRELAEKNPENLAAQFELDEEELEFLGAEDPKGAFEKAQELRSGAIAEKARAAPDRSQKRLF
ncbi:MAG: replication factor C large subunit, partial [Candidatus Micrarchaeota archaeon]